MTPLPPIILASTSPHRRLLLERLGVPFTVLAPGVAETSLPGETPQARALRLARDKAAAVAMQHPTAIVIGSDQVASLGGERAAMVLHKPGDRATCRGQLAAMSGQVAHFDTAVVLRHGGVELAHTEPTLVHFRELTPAQIEHYMEREPAFDCAGGFKCEGLGVTLFQSVETRDPTALVGLPLIWVCAALRELGVRV
ncbi:MAG TPA: nucleoside triphosphate pyrophosphatase [Steroidobacteraceae bacterium]|nr:nucleoside triphosphate pyrophosphatase [Steroidobacteraceae bacterium]